jgi:HK97 family phage portal protein
VETTAEREERISRLEEQRKQRRSQEGDVVEIAPGRGNLNRTSSGSFWDVGSNELFSSELLLIGNQHVSFTKLFQTQPWVAAAVMRMLTWAVRVPLKMYRRTGDDSRERLRPADHPLAAALVTPWDRGSMAQLTMHLLGPLLVHGNSVNVIEQGARDAIQFDAKDWRFSRPISPWRGAIEGFTVDTDQPQFQRDVSIDELIHVAWWSPAGPLGTSPLQQLGVSLQIEDAAQRYQKAIFRNGARPSAAIEASDEFLGLERDERRLIMQQLRSDVTELYTGPENTGRPVLLPPGLEWKIAGQSAVEVSLIDQRKIAREEVCVVYLIPPPMLGILDKATYSNIDVQHEMIYTDCVGPPLVLIENCINAQLVRALLGEDDVYVEYDFAAVLRGNRLQEIQALREAISSALLTPNEGRAFTNMPHSDAPEMDDFYLPFNNLAPIGSPPPAPTAPTQPPGALKSFDLFDLRAEVASR